MKTGDSAAGDPLVSLVVPVFDRPELLEPTLESVRDQTYEAWECLLVDDGSGADTLELMKTFADSDGRFRLLRRHRPPKGAPTCRNIGKEEARGRYTVFLDSDDLLTPWCVEGRVETMEAHPGCDAGLFQGLSFREELFDLSAYANKLQDGHPGAEDLLAAYLRREINWHTTAPVWRAGFLRRLAWDEEASTWQDREFHISALLEEPDVFVASALPDYFKRLSPGGASVSATVDDLTPVSDRMRLYNRVLRRLPESHGRVFRRAVREECRWLVTRHSVRGGARHRALMSVLHQLDADFSVPTRSMEVLGAALSRMGDLGVPLARGLLIRMWLGGKDRGRTEPAACPPDEVEAIRRRLGEKLTGPRRWP